MEQQIQFKNKEILKLKMINEDLVSRIRVGPKQKSSNLYSMQRRKVL